MKIQMFSGVSRGRRYLGCTDLATGAILYNGKLGSPERFAKWIRDRHPEAIIYYPKPWEAK
jgi:hypothetical protein